MDTGPMKPVTKCTGRPPRRGRAGLELGRAAAGRDSQGQGGTARDRAGPIASSSAVAPKEQMGRPRALEKPGTGPFRVTVVGYTHPCSRLAGPGDLREAQTQFQGRPAPGGAAPASHVAKPPHLAPASGKRRFPGPRSAGTHDQGRPRNPGLPRPQGPEHLCPEPAGWRGRHLPIRSVTPTQGRASAQWPGSFGVKPRAPGALSSECSAGRGRDRQKLRVSGPLHVPGSPRRLAGRPTGASAAAFSVPDSWVGQPASGDTCGQQVSAARGAEPGPQAEGGPLDSPRPSPVMLGPGVGLGVPSPPAGCCPRVSHSRPPF